MISLKLFLSALIKSHNSLPSDYIEEDPEFGDTTIFYDWKECSTIQSVDLDHTALNESIQVVPEDIVKLSIPELRRKLLDKGEIPGPITPATKGVYMKRLARLQSGITYSKVTRKHSLVLRVII